MIMDGKTMNVGAVAALRRIKSASAVARHVLDHTKHSLLVGDQATQFAIQMGFSEESLTTDNSKKLWKEWHNGKSCQPNYWTAVTPDPSQQCGPYRPISSLKPEKVSSPRVDQYNHDTIGMVAIDRAGNVAAGTSTNGAKYKIPGRVGDSPVAGAGGYAAGAGGAAATGDGDVMLRFLPSFLAVEEMRRGTPPPKAAQIAISRIAEYYPDFMGAVVAVAKDGRYGAACNGIYSFPFVVHDETSENPRLEQVECNNSV